MLCSFAFFEAHDDYNLSGEDEISASTIEGVARNHNEEPWTPHDNFHQHAAKNHNRQTITIEVPGRLIGETGAWKVHFGKNETELVLKKPHNPILVDPSGLHSHLGDTHGRRFGDDSSKTQSLRDSTRSKSESWLMFRHRIPFRATKPNNFKYPWFDVTQTEVK